MNIRADPDDIEYREAVKLHEREISPLTQICGLYSSRLADCRGMKGNK